MGFWTETGWRGGAGLSVNGLGHVIHEVGVRLQILRYALLLDLEVLGPGLRRNDCHFSGLGFRDVGAQRHWAKVLEAKNAPGPGDGVGLGRVLGTGGGSVQACG